MTLMSIGFPILFVSSKCIKLSTKSRVEFSDNVFVVRSFI